MGIHISMGFHWDYFNTLNETGVLLMTSQRTRPDAPQK